MRDLNFLTRTKTSKKIFILTLPSSCAHCSFCLPCSCCLLLDFKHKGTWKSRWKIAFKNNFILVQKIFLQPMHSFFLVPIFHFLKTPRVFMHFYFKWSFLSPSHNIWGYARAYITTLSQPTCYQFYSFHRQKYRITASTFYSAAIMFCLFYSDRESGIQGLNDTPFDKGSPSPLLSQMCFQVRAQNNSISSNVKSLYFAYSIVFLYWLHR